MQCIALGFAVTLSSLEEPLNLLEQILEKSGI